MTSQSDVLFTVDNIVYFHVAQQCLIERLLKQKCANMTLTVTHRRRIELEDKANVVGSDWGTES